MPRSQDLSRTFINSYSSLACSLNNNFPPSANWLNNIMPQNLRRISHELLKKISSERKTNSESIKKRFYYEKLLDLRHCQESNSYCALGVHEKCFRLCIVYRHETDEFTPLQLYRGKAGKLRSKKLQRCALLDLRLER